MRPLTTTVAAVILATTVSADPDLPDYDTVRIAHAAMGCSAFAFFFPLGAVPLRLFSFRNVYIVHAIWMMLTYCIALASVSMGLWLAIASEQLDNYHPYLGLVVITSLVLQPITGLVHHWRYKSTGGPNVATYLHLWWGRAFITLGIITGGVGFPLTGDDDTSITGYTWYGILAGCVWGLWMTGVYLAHLRSKRRLEDETGDKAFGSESINMSSRAAAKQSKWEI